MPTTPPGPTSGPTSGPPPGPTSGPTSTGFVDHVDDAFLRTWTLLEYLTCHVPVDTTTTADLVAAAAWAHEAYTAHGQHRPSPTAELHFPTHDAFDNPPNNPAGSTSGALALIGELENLLTVQLEAATTGDLAEALRVRGARDHIRQAHNRARAGGHA